MNNPTEEIRPIIKKLCQPNTTNTTTTTSSSSETQAKTILTYFSPDVSFQHPLCVIPSFNSLPYPLPQSSWNGSPINSRAVLLAVYRWYSFLSPNTVVGIDSVAFDQHAKILYVSLHQHFAIWFIPFYNINVSLVTRLHLQNQFPEHSANGDTPTRRYLITRQEDHYQVNEFIKFLLPFAAPLLWAAQLFGTLVAVISFMVVDTIGLRGR